MKATNEGEFTSLTVGQVRYKLSIRNRGNNFIFLTFLLHDIEVKAFLNLLL